MLTVMLALAGTPFATQTALSQSRSLAGQNLAGRDFAGKNLAGVDFSGANLRGANFRQSNLRGASFRNADLRGTAFTEANLTGVDFTGAQAGFSAERANLSSANLEGLDLRDVRFRDTNLRGANLKGTKGWGEITGSVLDGADVAGADFSQATGEAGATLRSKTTRDAGSGLTRSEGRAEIRPRSVAAATQAETQPPVSRSEPPQKVAQTPAVTFKGPDLRGQSFVKKKLANEDFRGAQLDGADFTLADLTNATFLGASVRNVKFTSANLNAADLSDLDLRDAIFERARVVDAKFDRANLESQTLHLAGSIAMLPSAELVRDLPYGVNASMLRDRNNGSLSFRGANLRHTRIFGDLERVDFRRADVRGADFSGAENLEKAIFNGAIYDSRTRWDLNPGTARATRGDDAPVGVQFYHGGWVIETARGSGPDAADLGLLDLFADGNFEWVVSATSSVIKGRWSLAPAGRGAPVVVLSGGEKGLTWTMSFKPDPAEDRVELVDQRGGPERRFARRAKRS